MGDEILPVIERAASRLTDSLVMEEPDESEIGVHERAREGDLLCMAPMRGVTTRVFRSVYERFFDPPERAIAPFIPTVKADRVKPKLLADVLPVPDARMLLEPQMISKDADDMLLLARALADLGYTRVNWNLGCPWPQVVKKNRGSGLLAHPDELIHILDSFLARSPISCSLKVRLGRETPAELRGLLPRLDAFPLDEIIIHARTARQMYEGTCDLDAFAECLVLTRHPVCYNGDLFSKEDFDMLRGRFPEIKRWMIGRGLVRDPFLPARLRGRVEVPAGGAALEVLRDYHDALCEAYRELYGGAAPVLGKMKEFWSYLCHSFERPEKVFKKIRKAQNWAHYQDAVCAVMKGGV